jgi:N-methylhydantoinase A
MLRIGIDVGGTFTDFLVQEGDGSAIFKVLSTPEDPSIGLINGLKEIATVRSLTLEAFVPTIDIIVHGTTVTTNAVLTGNGARTGLITTEGVRDALEMRRGIREEQYNNRYTNVPPLVPRRRRLAVRGRIGPQGEQLTELDVEGITAAVRLLKDDGVEALAICLMNAFANPAHEQRAAEIAAEEHPGAYLSVSTKVLPAVRFYDRVSTTVLNAYAGPILKSYIEALLRRLGEQGFAGVLLIMQSNGGVTTPEAARDLAAMTLLSGPAAGPGAGAAHVAVHGLADSITVDMGGTSFDTALVLDGKPITVTDGEIDRRRLALPMLGIVTIGAGGGSVGWLDEGGLLQVGPQSAGADPGPACYGRGGVRPTCTDADLLLGYLDPAFFAGGKLPLNPEASRLAMTTLAGPLGGSEEEAAAGVYRVINNNMANGVREVTIKRGHDPRDFPVVVAGGAGPLHACMICRELEIPFFLVPRESSIFCAAGMLATDLKHDYVRSLISRWDQLDPTRLASLVDEMAAEGRQVLEGEGISVDQVRLEPALDLRYLKQYHEVTLPAKLDEVTQSPRMKAIASRFHAEHDRLYGYSLERERTPLELINVRLSAVGITNKPRSVAGARVGADPSASLKGSRRAYVPETGQFAEIPVYDGHTLKPGNRIPGPALVEQVNTTLFISGDFDAVVDLHGAFVTYLRDRIDALPQTVHSLLDQE